MMFRNGHTGRKSLHTKGIWQTGHDIGVEEAGIGEGGELFSGDGDFEESERRVAQGRQMWWPHCVISTKHNEVVDDGDCGQSGQLRSLGRLVAKGEGPPSTSVLS